MNNFYLTDSYKPAARTLGELYAEAMKELALAAPSVPIREFPRLDKITGGFRGREFSILCGATGVGKTALLANLSASLLKQRVPHFVASVETGHTDFIKRVISVLDRKDHNHGDPVPVETLKKIHIEHGNILQSECLSLSLYDNRIPVETLMSDIDWHVNHKECKVAMIDNLNFFMEVTKSSDQILEMDRVIHELIIFCKRIDVHIIMVMHPKKTVNGRVESEFDIKGSSTAVQEAHNVFLYNRPHPSLVQAGTATPNDRELKVQKMRRRGKFVGRTLLLKCIDSVSYQEGDVL